MTQRLSWAIALAAALIPSILVADPVTEMKTEIERFQFLEQKLQSAFQAYVTEKSESRNTARETGGDREFMQDRIEPVFRNIYGNDFTADDLDSIPTEQLEARFKSFYIAGFYQHSTPIVDHMLEIVSALESRNQVSREVAGRMFGYLIRARDFDAARTFRARFPEFGLENIPELVDPFSGETSSERKTVWEISKDGALLTRTELQLDGPQIIVFASLSCTPSKRSVSEIFQHEKLATVFAEHAVWIKPQDYNLSTNAIAEWNRQHPEKALRLMHALAEWPDFHSSSTPSTVTHKFRNNQRVAERSDARRAGAGMAGPISSQRNAADGRSAARPKGAPRMHQDGVAALAKGSAIAGALRLVPAHPGGSGCSEIYGSRY